jgi:ferredoxin
MGSIEMGGKKVDVKDGDSIISAAEQLGIPFSCKDGVCGSCLMKVLEGEDNLSDPSSQEEAFGLSGKKERLACQCKLKSGDVKIESGY